MGHKTRVVGGADSICSVALMEGLKAGRALVERQGTVTPEEFDKVVWAVMDQNLEAEYDMSAPGPKGQREKMMRRYTQPHEGVEVFDTDEQLDRAVDEAIQEEAAAAKFEPSPLRALGQELVEEYALKGRSKVNMLGKKFFMKKVEHEGNHYLAVGCSYGLYGGLRGFANAGMNVPVDALGEDKVAHEAGRPFVTTKLDNDRTYKVYFLHFKPGRRFRVWCNLPELSRLKKDAIRYYLIMSDTAQGFDKDPKANNQGVQAGFEILPNGLVIPKLPGQVADAVN